MPIEDVDYLKKNSIKQSYIFLVDSGDRDRIAYPTPSEYAIHFQTPFHNVIGFEVLDASIPRTMYNIGGGNPLYPTNNTISFYIHTDSSNISTIDPKTYVLKSVEPGDYTIQTLIAQINNSSVLEMNVNKDINMPMAKITVESVSNPPDVKNLLRFKCPYPFVLDMTASTMSEALGFDTYVSASEALKPITAQDYTTFNLSLSSQSSNTSNYAPNYKLYHSVDLPPVYGLGDTNTVYSGPSGIVDKQQISSTNYVAQSFTVDTKGYLTSVDVALSTSSGNVEGSAVWELWSNSTYNIINSTSKPSSKISLRNTVGLLDTDYVDGGLTVTTELSSLGAIPGFATLEPGIYWIVLKTQATQSVNMSVYYNDVPASLGSSLGQYMLISSDSGSTYSSYNDLTTGLEFNVSMSITTKNEYHSVTAPGILSLIGERFTVLRCKEIEENSYRSLAFSPHCLGLAKFRLGVVGYSENRLDFSKVPLREFHPIGKLSRLSFRFETASGLLYDFKGVNHTMTFAVHYLEPTQKNEFFRSILNPNYTGEFIKDVHYGEIEEDSDDQEYDNVQNGDETQNSCLDLYRIRENRHLPENVHQMDLEAMQRFAIE